VVIGAQTKVVWTLKTLESGTQEKLEKAGTMEFLKKSSRKS